MKFIDMFAGIGGFRSGLEKAGHECVGYIEWDKYARKSYQAIYNTEGEFTANDIREVKGIELPNVDLWTFGSPCQDISIAGKQKGLVKGGRSSMFFEVIRLLKERIGREKKVPAYLIMENVKALLSSNCGRDFARVLIEMDQVGYDVEWAVLNSADVVPQNRERVYIIGHLRGAGTRQVFPITRKSSETSKAKIVYEPLVNAPKHQSQIVLSPKGCTPTLTATDYKRPYKIAVRQVGNTVKQKGFSNPQRERIYSANGLSPTLNTAQGGGLEPKVLIERPLKGLTKNGWHFEQNVFSKNSIAATLKAAGGSGNIPKIVCKPCLTPDRVNKRQHGRRFKENGDPEFTLTSQDKHGVLIEDGKSIVIRKLTPRECWRLQGFTDEQFEKAKKAGISDTQLYKQAGNAVTVDVIEQIGKRLVLEDDETKRSSNFGINNKN
ncbi:DNA cytosine methyltransferase [Lactobacillus taiwanensis]|uniref:DNA (cytosine-5-)-methyltransferase n=1 Tax=Lactobacillus taiwanensis TaxID=508451 RepID=A0A256L8Z9_9LACO|nr:DNA cytosine methyltransferase [Lactobacillus taiwanensis]OYR86872.1 hypothetical protein CBF53_10505 [Lactobacillus taiwanensis]OYR89891.1 hypothetical protein CBF70_10985 [Lactobacillus taiwanensis]OYR90819.1 hypothetical protein CBF59_07925 [Lactobacillus taiwanensis]OYR93796.1 hypothetical protein CBF58_11260 [Lactobacillus taiwanensis]